MLDDKKIRSGLGEVNRCLVKDSRKKQENELYHYLIDVSVAVAFSRILIFNQKNLVIKINIWSLCRYVKGELDKWQAGRSTGRNTAPWCWCWFTPEWIKWRTAVEFIHNIINHLSTSLERTGLCLQLNITIIYLFTIFDRCKQELLKQKFVVYFQFCIMEVFCWKWLRHNFRVVE